MEASALRYSGGIGLQSRSPLLRLQSDERLVAYTRRGNQAAFEVLVSRYESRLLSFCRHLLGSREDAEDVLQEVFAAAFNALLADDRAINVRPWLYRIARNRSLNHLRRATAVGVDSMDVHFSEHGSSTADKVQQRERFRLLMSDIQALPETQRTALILREMEALSYEQIAEAMDTTVPGVKSLLVRARISLAEAAEARQLSCSDVRLQLGEIAEGLRRKPETVVRRHLRGCNRCTDFQSQLKLTNKALGVLLPIGLLAALRRALIVHLLGHSAGHSSAGAGASVSGSGATSGLGSATASAGAVGASGLGSAGALSAGAGAIVSKAAVGLAAAMVVTAGAVEVTHVVHPRKAAIAHHHVLSSRGTFDVLERPAARVIVPSPADKPEHPNVVAAATGKATPLRAEKLKPARTTLTPKQLGTALLLQRNPSKAPKPLPGRTRTQTDQTVLPATATTTGSGSGRGRTGTGRGMTGSRPGRTGSRRGTTSSRRGRTGSGRAHKRAAHRSITGHLR